MAIVGADTTVALAQELERGGLIKKEVLDHLSNLSPQVPSLRKHKYLFSQVFIATKNNMKAFMRMADIVEPFLSNPMAISSDDDTIGSEHIPDIVEILAAYASKWELIGTALRFQPQNLHSIRDSCAMMSESLKLSLLRLLDEWVIRKYEHTLPPTFKNLDRALNSELVGLGALAIKLKRAIASFPDKMIAKSYSALPYIVASFHFHSLTKIDMCQSVKQIDATEGNSVLLEMQATSDTQSNIECMWRDKNASIIASEQFLCIPSAELEHDGDEYSCIVGISQSRNAGRQHVTLHVHSPLDAIRDKLATMYSDKPDVPKDTWPPVSSKKFINLALIKQEAANYRNKLTQLTVRGDLDDILKDKEIIRYEEIIKNLKPKHLLIIEGRPGSGKTTLVHKITQDWASLPQQYSKTIRSMFLISLRVLNSLNKPRLELSDILNLFKLSETSIDQKLLEERDGKGVCFVFDGLDEFSPPDGDESVVYKIINKEYLVQSIVIVASRPAATAHLRNEATKVIEVLGFQTKEIFEYFEHYPFSNQSKSAELNEYLSTHPNILHMCYLPIYAVMIAFLFEVNGQVPKTETEIYKHFTNLTIMRSRFKSKEVPKFNQHMTLSDTEKVLLAQVCQLASKKTILNKQVLLQGEVEFTSSKDSDEYLGLITIDRIAGLYGLRNVYTFLHLTFQEYLAAFHISTLSYDEQLKMINRYGHKNHMLVVWKFYCGLVEFSESDKRFAVILQKTAQHNLLHFQCAYESQQLNTCVQVLDCVDHHISLVNKSNMSIPDFTAIGYVTSCSVHPTRLSIVRCNMIPETMHALAVEIQEHSFGRIEIIESIDDRETLKVLAAILYKSIELKELDIRGNKIDNIGAEVLSTGLSGCESLRRIVIANNRMSSNGVACIFKSLRQCNLEIEPNDILYRNDNVTDRDMLNCIKYCNKIQSLALPSLKDHRLLSKIQINWTELRKVKIVLSTPKIMEGQTIACFQHFQFLEVLALNGFVMDSSCTKYLAECLNNSDHLKTIDLSNNRLGDLEIIAFFSNLNCTSLVEISLNNNDIKFEYGMNFISLFECCDVHGKLKLYLRRNKITKSNVITLASILKNYPAELHLLDLGYNPIGSTGIHVLLESLKEFQSLEELYLCGDRIGSIGVKLLSSHLKYHGGLRTLSLMGNNLGGADIETLAKHIYKCPDIEEIDLSGNSLGSKAYTILSENLRVACIRVLKLNKCKMIGAAFSFGFPNLKTLHLNENLITDDLHLKSASLSELQLSHNKIGLGEHFLPSLMHCSSLQRLDLSHNHVNDNGASELATSLRKCSALMWLNLSGNFITDEAARNIISIINQCVHFRELNLSNNRIEDPDDLQSDFTWTEVAELIS